MLLRGFGRRTLATPFAARAAAPSSVFSSRLLATHAAPAGHGAAHGHADHKHDEHHHDDHHHDDHHEDGPTGYLWGKQPGVKYPRESWELITYFGIAATLVLGWVAINYSGKVSVEEYGQMEIARRRRERAQGVPEPEPLQLYVDPTKFRKNPVVTEQGPQ